MKQEFNNIKLPLIRKYISDHHGMDKRIWEDEAGIEYKKAMEAIKEFDGEKVEITFNAEQDFLSATGLKKTGKIIIEDDKVKFYEGQKRARFYYLDAGIFSGWFATLIVTKITPLDSPKKKVRAHFDNCYTLMDMKGNEICGFSELARMKMYCKKRMFNLTEITGI